MFRETDVVNGRTRRDMRAMPILDGRASAIIDIGKSAVFCAELALTS